jgi:hypothetical protein
MNTASQTPAVIIGDGIDSKTALIAEGVITPPSRPTESVLGRLGSDIDIKVCHENHPETPGKIFIKGHDFDEIIEKIQAVDRLEKKLAALATKE